jgi:hypothetical protein
MPLGLGILARQEMLAAWTALGLDGDDDIDLFNWQQCPRLPLMTELPAGSPSTRLTAGTWVQRLGRITRWRARGGLRVLLHLLPQLEDRGFYLLDSSFQTLNGLLQCSYPCLKRPDVGLSLRWDALPHLLR